MGQTRSAVISKRVLVVYVIVPLCHYYPALCSGVNLWSCLVCSRSRCTRRRLEEAQDSDEARSSSSCNSCRHTAVPQVTSGHACHICPAILHNTMRMEQLDEAVGPMHLSSARKNARMSSSLLHLISHILSSSGTLGALISMPLGSASNEIVELRHIRTLIAQLVQGA